MNRKQAFFFFLEGRKKNFFKRRHYICFVLLCFEIPVSIVKHITVKAHAIKYRKENECKHFPRTALYRF